MAGLKEYNQKRNFAITKEPKGKKENSTKQLKFSIQYHEARAKHYDLRLEWKGVAISFAVPKNLSQNPKDKRLAVHVEDHPISYMNFSGTIPKGEYGAGTVKLWDKGTYVPLSDPIKGMKKGEFKILLNGQKAKGVFTLAKMDEKNWLIIKNNDEFAQAKKNEETKNPFNTIDVKLCVLKSEIPKGKDFLFEIKYDGYRIVAYKENKKITLKSRNNNDYTKKFENITTTLEDLSSNSFVLDGEVVSFDKNGRSNFGQLQSQLKSNKTNNFYYIVFDILALNGKDLREKNLLERKKILNNVLEKCPKNIIESQFVIGKGLQCFKVAKENQLEGIVGKKLNSKYNGQRDEDWIKIKNYRRQEFVIVGFKTTEKNNDLSAVLLGYFDKKKLKYIGKVGTGFNEKSRKELRKKFNKLKTEKTVLINAITEKNVVYIKPELVAEIQFAEITEDGFLRQPSFIGLRDDKNAEDVKLEGSYE